jgi:hypothetical protein
MKNLFFALALILIGGTVATAQGGQDPADLATGNLLKNPTFMGTPCYQDWQIEVVGVACNTGNGYVWLNHNNRAGDPAVKQTLEGLTIGSEYEITVGWRGGDHGPIHGVSGARNIFAIDIDGREIKRLTTSSNYTAWMVNEKVEAEATTATPIKFTATATSHTIRFRGEVGADGDVLLAWAKVKSSKINACSAIDALIAKVESYLLATGVEKSLLSNLPSAKDQLAKKNETPAIEKLESFISKVQSNGKKDLTAEQEDTLVKMAQEIIDAIKSGNYDC